MPFVARLSLHHFDNAFENRFRLGVESRELRFEGDDSALVFRWPLF